MSEVRADASNTTLRVPPSLWKGQTRMAKSDAYEAPEHPRAWLHCWNTELRRRRRVCHGVLFGKLLMRATPFNYGPEPIPSEHDLRLFGFSRPFHRQTIEANRLDGFRSGPVVPPRRSGESRASLHVSLRLPLRFRIPPTPHL